MSHFPKFNAGDISGMTDSCLARLSYTARCALGFAIKHRWRIEMLSEQTLRFRHPATPDAYKLATLSGLEYMGRENDWQL